MKTPGHGKFPPRPLYLQPVTELRLGYGRELVAASGCPVCGAEAGQRCALWGGGPVPDRYVIQHRRGVLVHQARVLHWTHARREES